jgi:hypothetical protein
VYLCVCVYVYMYALSPPRVMVEDARIA